MLQMIWFMQVFCNTSPISNLAVIGRLQILQRQFGIIHVPTAVLSELRRLEHPFGKQATHQAHSAGWLRVCQLTDRSLSKVLNASLDAGESEAIALAIESEAGFFVSASVRQTFLAAAGEAEHGVSD